MKRRESILAALFLDLPFLVDSFWRKAEYEANRNHDYRVGPGGATIAPRPLYRSAHFAWLLLVIVFVGYGPTHAPLCQIGGNALPRTLYAGLSLVAAAASLALLGPFRRALFVRARERLRSCEASKLRAGTLWAVLCAFTLGMAIMAVGTTYQLAKIAAQSELCLSGGWSWRSIALLAAVGTAIGIAFFASRRARPTRFWLRHQPLLVVALVAFVWIVLAEPTAREADGLPYRHAYALIAAAMFAIALATDAFATGLLSSPAKRLKADFTAALRRSELFVQRQDPDLSVHRVWHALVNGALYQPLMLALLPSLVAIAVPDRYLYGSAAAALAFSVLLLAWGSISTRWQQMVLYVRRWFLTGTPFFLSLIVVGLAGARLLGNQYVATVLAAAPFGAIFMWILMIYGLLWLFEYVVNQALGVRLLSLLSPDSNIGPGYVPYEPEQLVDPKVSPRDRFLSMHGAGRFAIVGHRTRPEGDAAVFHTYGYTELFAALASKGPLLEGALGQPGLARRLEDGAREIERRSRLYFNIVNAALLLIFAVLAIYARYHDRQHTTAAVVEAEVARDKTGNFDLAEALAQRARAGRPALVIAASGGGTRAALYTASALQGLAELGVLDDAVLLSGVSGGGVALAHYATQRDRLPGGTAFDREAWKAFKQRVSQPFIQDVIEGAMEWRLVGATPLSALLVESFGRRLDAGEPTAMGSIGELGLILNTSITGHPAGDSRILSRAIQFPSGGRAECAPYAYLSGARLAFTNVRAQDAFPRPHGSSLPDVGFPFVLIDDPTVRVAAAAALNANFPPVFPNARVDLIDRAWQVCDGRRSYYVTDGGATENLGLISALYALRSALASWPQDTPLPEIHVIALEASAVDFDYTQDRGLGAATGGSKERLAGGLTQALLGELESDMQRLGSGGQASPLSLHYLPMPLALRTRGGIGTHWMLAHDILVTNPRRATPVGVLARTLAIGPGATDRVRITDEELFHLLNAMHSVQAPLCTNVESLRGDAGKVAQWICGSEQAGNEDLHVLAWRQLVDALVLSSNARTVR